MAVAGHRVPTAAVRVRERQPDRQSAAGLHLDERVALLRDRLEARADSREAAQLRTDVREARGFVRGFNAREVSADTHARYSRVVDQMRTTGQQPERAASRANFQFRRAALVHVTRDEVKTALRDLDRFKRSGEIDRAADAYLRIREGLETLRRLPPSTGDREADMERKSVYTGPAQAQVSNGKRPSLAGLPSDWRDLVQREVRDADRPAVAVMALSGARPAEVKGVQVRQDGDQIALSIRGAKVDNNRGVESRTLSFVRSDLAGTEAGRDLLAWLGNRSERTITHAGTVAAFRERVARAAERAGLPHVSAYTFRHGEARRLKLDGTPRGEISTRLGHRAQRSQSKYG